MKEKRVPTAAEAEKIAVGVSIGSIIGNLVLSVFKVLAGFLASSSAMVSDGVHSASDVFSSVIVIIGVKLAGKEPDRDHPYGHERFECVAAIVLAAVLVVTGVFIAHNAIESLADKTYNTAIPGVLALVAAGVSIAVKEAMFWITRHYALRLDSSALRADAWHHRSDALSSVGALIGIGGARLGFPILEPIASLMICAMILKAAADIFRDAVRKMVDRSCGPETEARIRATAEREPGVVRVDKIQTREFGNRIYVDLEIAADGNATLSEAHAIAERVHDAVEREFPNVKHIMVHVNPDSGE